MKKSPAVPTIIDSLLLLDFILITVENASQRVANLAYDSFTCVAQLREVVCLLYECVQGADLEFRNGERDGCAIVGRHGASQGSEGFVLVARLRYGGRQGHEEVFVRRHGWCSVWWKLS